MPKAKNKEPKKNRVGDQFGRWSIMAFDHYADDRSAYYLCLCECGSKRVVQYKKLKSGDSKSCGCLQKDRRGDPYLVTARYIWNVNYNDGCSFETFLALSQRPCYYCGAPPSNRYNVYVTKKNQKKASATTVPDARAYKAWFIYNGLDRLDSNKNHAEDNVVPCCYVCNTAKLDWTIDEFRDWIVRVYNNFIVTGK